MEIFAFDIPWFKPNNSSLIQNAMLNPKLAKVGPNENELLGSDPVIFCIMLMDAG